MTSVASAAPAQPAAASETTLPNDFMALLLLLTGVGTGVPGLEPQPAGDPPAPTADGADAPDLATSPTALTAAAAAAAFVPLVAPPPVAAPPAPVVATAAGPSDPDAAAAGRPVAPPVSDSTTPATPPAPSPAPAASPSSTGDDLAAVAAPANPATPSAASSSGAAPAAQRPAPPAGASELRTTKPAATTDEVLPVDTPRPAAPATSAPGLALKAVSTEAPAAPGGGADDGAGHEAPKHDGRAATPAAPVATSGPASAPALREAPQIDAPAAPIAVEPRVVADQIVSAARIVVREGLTRMHVDLEPPALGAVRLHADARGETVSLTITAERPQTLALLTQALPDIQQALASHGVAGASVAVLATPLSDTGRRAPDRRPAEPRERPNPQTPDRRRAPRAPRTVSAVDITV
ncbi:MAG: flagellar hook-length control protein FliK [Candidatus Rokubacteria bacterium]|nr:flagellar hook-length control protein FliK [Candidatus Rokubacteria bacterium]